MNNKNGFTLIELIVSMGIGAILSVMLITIFFSSNHFMTECTINIDNQISAKQTLDQITNKIRRNDISGKIETNIQEQTIRIYGDTKDEYEEYYFENEHLGLRTKSKYTTTEVELYKLKGLTVEEDEKGKIVLKAKYNDSKNKETILERVVVCRSTR